MSYIGGISESHERSNDETQSDPQSPMTGRFYGRGGGGGRPPAPHPVDENKKPPKVRNTQIKQIIY